MLQNLIGQYQSNVKFVMAPPQVNYAYPMHTNLNLMNLKNKLDEVNVDSVANFNANTKGGMNVIDSLVGTSDSVINFGVEEADIDGQPVLVVVDEEETPVAILAEDEAGHELAAIVEKPGQVLDSTKPKVRPTNYIKEFETAG